MVMTMSNRSLILEVKAMRLQLAKLEAKCIQREDKITKCFFILEPFFNALTPEMNAKIMKELEGSE